jgi:hypothetical protein
MKLLSTPLAYPRIRLSTPLAYPSLQMESIITSYGIDFAAFKEYCYFADTRLVVAGSTALYGYLKQENIEPGFVPNDMDIFIYGERPSKLNTPYTHIKSVAMLAHFLASYNYTVDNHTNDALNYSDCNSDIVSVTSFCNPGGKKIQIIAIDDLDVKENLSMGADLSACLSWWNYEKNIFETFDPQSTKYKEMYLLNEFSAQSIRCIERIEKYEARGFTLIDRPGPYIDERDPRDELSSDVFKGITVCDIFTLDEYSITDFLKKSENNIVLKSGDTYYAFQRNTLHKYMKTKEVRIGRIGLVYETPLNQCITLEAYHSLQYSDYSIYELKSAYSVPSYDERVKSLFNLNCYSIKQWITNTGCKKISFPAQKYINPVQRAHINVDDILAAHAYLQQPGALEAFHAAVLGLNNA